MFRQSQCGFSCVINSTDVAPDSCAGGIPSNGCARTTRTGITTGSTQSFDSFRTKGRTRNIPAIAPLGIENIGRWRSSGVTPSHLCLIEKSGFQFIFRVILLDQNVGRNVFVIFSALYRKATEFINEQTEQYVGQHLTRSPWTLSIMEATLGSFDATPSGHSLERLVNTLEPLTVCHPKADVRMSACRLMAALVNKLPEGKIYRIYYKVKTINVNHYLLCLRA